MTLWGLKMTKVLTVTYITVISSFVNRSSISSWYILHLPSSLLLFELRFEFRNGLTDIELCLPLVQQI